MSTGAALLAIKAPAAQKTHRPSACIVKSLTSYFSATQMRIVLSVMIGVRHIHKQMRCESAV